VVDLAVTERLAPLAPPGTVLVGESGISTAADVERLNQVGVSAALVGESLIVAPDRAAAVRALLAAP
jgi:indole-3-glycerol phosphate synthase